MSEFSKSFKAITEAKSTLNDLLHRGALGQKQDDLQLFVRIKSLSENFETGNCD